MKLRQMNVFVEIMNMIHFRTNKSLTTHHDLIRQLLAVEIIDYRTISAYDSDQIQQILTFCKYNER
jgi:hypothetical protein